ncbi:MAG TPA: hypothetical protein VKW78_06955 [Terriglobales bacterium]|nr:hypothetical protein [Terriglobales bacterium]
MRSGFLLVGLFWLGLCLCFGQDQGPSASSSPSRNKTAETTNPSKAALVKSPPKDPKDDPQAALKQQILDLLERSHAANDEVLPDQRVSLLARQINMITRLQPETGEKWAEELFQLAEDQADDQKRARMQMLAIQMVAPGDPEFGLKLLHQMKPVSAGSDPAALMASDPLSAAATEVFQSLARTKGESQIPRLRMEALRLAAESQYPYSAMAGVALETVRERRPGNIQSPDGPSVLEAIFDEAVGNYERSTATWTTNSDFARMVQRMAYHVPKDKVRHALELFVTNAQNVAPPSGVSMTVNTGTGSTQITDPLEIALFHYVSLLRQFDPELLNQIAESHPQVAQGLAGLANVRWTYGDSSIGSPTDANQITRLRAQGMASWNPDNALALTQGITDPNMRAVTMGSVAEQVAADQPGKAMQLLDQAQKTAGDSQDLKTQLQLAASRADVAQSTNNSAMLRDALRQGFEVGDQLLRQEQDDNQTQVSWYMLGSLVQTGIKSEPDLTLSYINSFSLPYVRAELLLDAAQALRFNRRIVARQSAKLGVGN